MKVHPGDDDGAVTILDERICNFLFWRIDEIFPIYFVVSLSHYLFFCLPVDLEDRKNIINQLVCVCHRKTLTYSVLKRCRCRPSQKLSIVSKF